MAFHNGSLDTSWTLCELKALLWEPTNTQAQNQASRFSAIKIIAYKNKGRAGIDARRPQRGGHPTPSPWWVWAKPSFDRSAALERRPVLKERSRGVASR
jgi:hypothetical protein